jgi:Ser/Thr protein kinase RdoA (MazF antagonist)
MERWIVELPGGGTAFAKLAIDDATAGYLRAEHRIYSQVEGAFMPRLLGWEDDGEWPLLLLEDLSGAHWPPSWRGGDVEAVLTSLDAVHAAAAPPELPALRRDELHTWREVEADPAPFLSLGLCSPEWLDAVLPELLAATDRVELEGDALLHLDVRSDNLCIHDGRAVLVDWNWAMTGNPAFDVAFWLPSLHMEGGPPPADVLPAAGDMAAVVAGYFAPLAGLPPPEGAPNVRPLQLAQLEVALPWAVEARGLPPLGG